MGAGTGGTCSEPRLGAGATGQGLAIPSEQTGNPLATQTSSLPWSRRGGHSVTEADPSRCRRGAPQRRRRRAPGRGAGPGAQEDADWRALAARLAAGNEVTFVKRNRPHGRRGRISLANAIQRPSGRRTLLAAAAAFLRRDSRGGVERGSAAAAPSPPRAPSGRGGRRPARDSRPASRPKGAPAGGQPREPPAAPKPGRGRRGRGLRGFKAGGARRGHRGELRDCDWSAAAPSGQVGPHSHALGVSPRPAGAGVGARRTWG